MTHRFRVWDGEKMHEPPHKYLIDSQGRVRYASFEAMEFCETCQALFSTGLTDAEGTEIFEGDVLQTAHGRYVVEYKTDAPRNGGWVGKPLGKGLTRGFDRILKQGRVIGNKFEDPDLLEAARG